MALANVYMDDTNPPPKKTNKLYARTSPSLRGVTKVKATRSTRGTECIRFVFFSPLVSGTNTGKDEGGGGSKWRRKREKWWRDVGIERVVS